MLSSQIYANLGNKNAVSAISIVQLSGAECTICAIKCATLFQFLHHKKLEHKESVKRFINNVKYAGEIVLMRGWKFTHTFIYMEFM